MDGTPLEKKYPLNAIYYYLTDTCNLRCRHCWISPGFLSGERPATYLPVGLFESITDQAIPLGLTAVKLTGGEPLLHPGIEDILGVVRANGLSLWLETNGTLVSPGLVKAVAACKDPMVSVSLDGLEETHEWMRRIGGCFNRTVRAIDELTSAGIDVQVIMSIARRNVDQMSDVVAIAESLQCGSVKFNIVQPVARGGRLHETGETLAVEDLISLGKWVENELSARTDMPLYFNYPMAFRSLHKLFGGGGSWCSRCGILNNIGVLADGSYSMCGIGEHVPDLIYGNASTDPLAKVWNEAPVINEIREGLPGRIDGVCRDCGMKQLCQGSCIAFNYYRNKDLWAPFWFCDEARKRQLFPESRLWVSR